MKKLILSLFLAAGLLLTATAAAAAAETEAYDLAPRAMAVHDLILGQIEELYDDYSTYYTADEYRMMIDDYQGAFGGVGIYMLTIDGEVVINGVAANTPAAGSEIASGDVIVAVDATDIAGLDAYDAMLLIRGEIGTNVTLTLRRAESEELYNVTLTRQEIVTETVTGQNIAAVANTAYIIISNFTEHTAEEFVDVYNQLRAEQVIDHLIIDLRSNSGGSFPAAINIGNLFVPAGAAVVREKTSTGMNEYKSSSGSLYGIDILLLQNAWTASASEVLIGALRDNNQATVIGSTSYGKGITQSIFAVGEGGFRYTRSRYYTPSGYDLHGLGIVPDIEAADPEGISSEDYFSYDTQLNPHLHAAIEYLQP